MAYNPEATPHPSVDDQCEKEAKQLSPIVIAIGLPLALISGPMILSQFRTEFVRHTLNTVQTLPIYQQDVKQIQTLIGQSALISALSCGLLVKCSYISSNTSLLSLTEFFESISLKRFFAYVLAAETYLVIRNAILGS